MAAQRLTLKQIFAAPLLIGLASVVGLVAALVGDGLGHAVSWIALAAPVGAVIWGRLRRAR